MKILSWGTHEDAGLTKDTELVIIVSEKIVPARRLLLNRITLLTSNIMQFVIDFRNELHLI